MWSRKRENENALNLKRLSFLFFFFNLAHAPNLPWIYIYRIIFQSPLAFIFVLMCPLKDENSRRALKEFIRLGDGLVSTSHRI